MSAFFHFQDIHLFPSYLFQTYFRHSEPNLEIKALDVNSGVDFILSTWKYAKEGSRPYVEKIVERNESGAVYKDGKPVSAIVTVPDGLLAMLYTLNDHRKKGYAKVAVKYAMREQAMNGMTPCLTVELRNEPSKAFHESLGMKVAHVSDWVTFHKPGFD